MDVGPTGIARPFHWRRARGQTPSSTLRLACRWRPNPSLPLPSDWEPCRPLPRSRALLARRHRQCARCSPPRARSPRSCSRPSAEDVALRELAIFAGGLVLMLAHQPAAAAPRAGAAAGADARSRAGSTRSSPACGSRSAAGTPRPPSSPRRSTRCSSASRPSGATASAARSPRRRASGCAWRRSSTTASARASPAWSCSSGASRATCRRRRASGRARGAGDRPREPRGGAPDRTPAAPRGARRPRPGQRAARARASGWPSTPSSQVDVHVQPGLPTFSGDEELVLYRVAQEALTNVARHAGAQARRGPARAARRPSAARGRRRRHGLPARRRARAAACAGCASARC